MPHWRKMMSSDYIGSWDIEGAEPTLEIERVEQKTLKNAQGEDTAPVVYFKGAKKGMVCNVTNAKTIARLAGSDDTDKWPGTKITLYTTEVSAFGTTAEAIRVRRKTKE